MGGPACYPIYPIGRGATFRRQPIKISRTLQALYGLAAFCLVPGLAIACYHALVALTVIDCEWEMFLGGIGISAIFWFVFMGRNKFLAVLEHELTHMVAALLLLKVPVNLHATHQEGGALEWRGPQFGNWLVTLAPYFLPTPTLVLLAFGWMVGDGFMPTFIGMLGFTTGFNLWSTLEETRFSQPDLQQYPQWFNLSILAAGNLLFTGMVLGFVASGKVRSLGGYRGVQIFLADAWTQTLQVFGAAGSWLS